MVFSGPWERDQETIFKSDALHLLGLWPPGSPKMGWHASNFLSWAHLWCHHYCKGNPTWILPSVLPPSLRRAAVGWAGPCPALDLLLRCCLWSTCLGPYSNWQPPHMCMEDPCWGGLLRSKLFLRGWHHHHSLKFFLPTSASGKSGQCLYEGGEAGGNFVFFWFCLWQKILTLIH